MTEQKRIMYSEISANKRKTFLLIGVFFILILGLGYLFDYLFQSGGAWVFVAVIISVVMSLTGYFSGDKVALWQAGAKGPIKQEDNPYVYKMVENLAITSGLPMPKVYLIPDAAPNAFATGRDPKHASVAITAGIIERLENEELEGVIAHEMSHIKNYDIRVMMLVGVLAGVVIMMADFFLRGRLFHGRDSENRNAGGVLLIVGLVFAILSPIFAQLIQLAVSRKREFLADASGALLTRYPEGLARALEKIASYTKPMQKASDATAHLYISNPFGAKAMKGFAKLFSTHPPMEERVKALRGMTV